MANYISVNVYGEDDMNCEYYVRNQENKKESNAHDIVCIDARANDAESDLVVALDDHVLHRENLVVILYKYTLCLLHAASASRREVEVEDRGASARGRHAPRPRSCSRAGWS